MVTKSQRWMMAVGLGLGLSVFVVAVVKIKIMAHAFYVSLLLYYRNKYKNQI